MKKLLKLKRPIALVMALTIAGAVWTSPKFVKEVRAENASVQKYEEDIAALEAEQAELENKIAGIEDTQATLAERKQYLDSLVSTVGTKIQKSQVLVDELKTQISDAEKAIKDYETSITNTTERIKERMILSQQTGTESYISVLIGAESIGDFLSRFERLSNMLDYDRENLENYKAQKEALSQQVADLKNAKTLQESTLDTLAADKEEAARLAEESEGYWTSLQKDKEAYSKQYNEAQAQEAALDGELSALLQQLEAQRQAEEERRRQEAEAAEAAGQEAPQYEPIVSADGDYMWPLPSGGYVSCYYGDSDPNGAPHYAVDTAIASGTPIYAANDGTVVRAEGHWSYGNYILLDHGNSNATLYAHCSSLCVSPGQTVSKGDIIGYVGSTGFSTGSHLHFEFLVNGNKVNPLGYMSNG